MDYTECFKEVILKYSFLDPIVEFICHNLQGNGKGN